jgi:hypothetical protein
MKSSFQHIVSYRPKRPPCWLLVHIKMFSKILSCSFEFSQKRVGFSTSSIGKVSQGRSTLFELCLMVNLYLNLNKGLLVLKSIESIFYFPFCLKTAPGTRTSVVEISQVYHWHTHLRSPAQVLHNIDYTFMTMDMVNYSEQAAPRVSWTTTSLLCISYFSGAMVCAPFISLSLIIEFDWVSILIC